MVRQNGDLAPNVAVDKKQHPTKQKSLSRTSGTKVMVQTVMFMFCITLTLTYTRDISGHLLIKLYNKLLITISLHYLAPEGVARYCFHPVCLCVCVSVCLCVCVSVCLSAIFWYFISRLLEEISI